MMFKILMARVLDVVSAPLLFLILPLLKGLARAEEHVPLCRGLLDRSGLAVLPHHCYSPVVLPGDLRAPRDQPRPLPGIDWNEA